MGKLQIYKASAGSGKTWLLTEFYLKKAFEHPLNFKHILAVTFTNKAADEMKTRILSKLTEIIEKKNQADHFDAIKKHVNINDEQLVELAESLRKNILHNYTNFKVGTIDSFIQKMIRAFSFELNLNSGYDIEFDIEKVIIDLIDLLFDNIPDNPDLRNRLTEFAIHKIDDGVHWDFRKEIQELSKELFKEDFQKFSFNKDFMNDNTGNNSEIFNELHRIRTGFEKKMSELSENYKNIIDKNNIDYTALGRDFKTISNFFINVVRDKNYDVKTQALTNALNGVESWYAKSAKTDVIETVRGIYPELSAIVHLFFETLKDEGELYYSVLPVLKQFYAFGLLNNMANLLPEYRNNNNLLLISDVTLLLKAITGKNDAPFIYEKAGNRYNHILIDEFQDTSNFQWSNFKPLIINSLSQSFDNLIVGDVKQSVYRWRNGDWKLLLEGVKKEIGNEYIKEDKLEINYRSKKNIVLFNNSVFNCLPKIIQQQFNRNIIEYQRKKRITLSENAAGMTLIVDAYSGCKQSVTDKDDKNGGRVKVKFFDSSLKNEEYLEQLAQCLPQNIDDLLKKGKVKARDIGILVRKNDEAEKTLIILNDFQKQNPQAFKYAVISPKSLKIIESKAVKIIISAMSFINDPDNKLNISELLFYYSLFKDNTTNLNEIFASVNEKTYQRHLPEAFFNKDITQNYETLYDLYENIIQIFELNVFKDDLPYIRAFGELILNQSFVKSVSLNEFIDYWNEKGYKTTLDMPETSDAVRIMTIHKSKGLAFKVVFIPFTNWKIDHGNQAPFLWVNSDIHPFNLLNHFPVKYSSLLEKTCFINEYFNEKLMSYTDALNLLYVAFTRAQEELYIYTKDMNSEKISDISDIGQALFLSITQNGDVLSSDSDKMIPLNSYYDIEKSEFCFEQNNELQQKPVEVFLNNSENIDYKLYTENSSFPNWHQRINIKYRAKDFFIESNKEIENKVNYGILMHKIFSEIRTINDIETSLQTAVFEGIINQTEKNELHDNIFKIISRPTINDWFSNRYEVKNEEALLTTGGEIRIPDRVLINNEKIIVIDFKFGKKHVKYIEQIMEYKQLLEQAYHLKPEAYIYYVEDDVLEAIA